MNPLKALALASLLSAIALFALAAAEGDLRVAWVVFFPVLLGEGFLPFMGFLALFAAAVLWFLGQARDLARAAGGTADGVAPGRVAVEPHPEEPGRRRSRGGGIVLIGPIPIVWGTDRRITVALLVLGITLTVLLALLFYVGPRLGR